MGPRRDVLRNRQRLLVAAVEVFREGGAAVPLEQVARRAGVGRATLYRHFPDRAALIAAVLELRVETLERCARAHPGADLLERLLVEICWFQVDIPGLVPAVRGASGQQQLLDDVVRRTGDLLSAGLERGRAAGLVRPGTTLGDVFLLIAMVDGVIAAQATGLVPTPVERALELLLRTVRTEERAGVPVPVAELRGAAADAGSVAGGHR